MHIRMRERGVFGAIAAIWEFGKSCLTYPRTKLLLFLLINANEVDPNVPPARI